MKKILIIVLAVFLLVAGVFAAAESYSEDDSAIDETLNRITTSDLAVEVREYVKNFVEKRGIDSTKIKNISKVDFDDLPKEVNIENVNDANLAIYKVGYEEEEKDKNVYVVTYSLEKLRSQGDLIVAQDKRQFLNFGFDGRMSKDGFLKTATGVEGSLEKGYVMMRKGSITGISTNLDVVKSGGEINIIIYKNGELISFGNTLTADSEGAKKDYDTQSRGTVEFEKGDVISVYVQSQGDVAWQDVITLIEITTRD